MDRLTDEQEREIERIAYHTDPRSRNENERDVIESGVRLLLAELRALRAAPSATATGPDLSLESRRKMQQAARLGWDAIHRLLDALNPEKPRALDKQGKALTARALGALREFAPFGSPLASPEPASPLRCPVEGDPRDGGRGDARRPRRPRRWRRRDHEEGGLTVPSCEKCWERAGGDADRYRDLLKTEACTPAEQAGPYATVCDTCGRRTVHQYARICMTCGFPGGGGATTEGMKP